MKKKLSLFLIMLLIATGLFASSYVTASTSNIRLFDAYGKSVDINDVNAHDALDGLIVYADESVTFSTQFGDIYLDQGTLVTVLSWTENSAELYLVSGDATVNLTGKTDFRVYTPVALAGMFSKGEYRIISKTATEEFYNYSAGSALYVDSIKGEMKQVDWLSKSNLLDNSLALITTDEYKETSRYENPFVTSYYEKITPVEEIVDEPKEVITEEPAEEITEELVTEEPVEEVAIPTKPVIEIVEDNVPTAPILEITTEKEEEVRVPSMPSVTNTVNAVPSEAELTISTDTPSAPILNVVEEILARVPEMPSLYTTDCEMIKANVPTKPKMDNIATLSGRKDFPDIPTFFVVEVFPGQSLSPNPVKFTSVKVDAGQLLAPHVSVSVEKKTDSTLTY